MAWYTVSTYKRQTPGISAGVMIDSSIFEAADDDQAKSQSLAHSLLKLRGDFAALRDPSGKVIQIIEKSDAQGS